MVVSPDANAPPNATVVRPHARVMTCRSDARRVMNSRRCRMDVVTPAAAGHHTRRRYRSVCSHLVTIRVQLTYELTLRVPGVRESNSPPARFEPRIRAEPNT